MEDVYSALFDALEMKDKMLREEARNAFRLRHVSKGTSIFRQGEPILEAAFTGSEGVTRSFYLTEDGKEFTQCFETEFGRPLLPSFSIDSDVCSAETLEALTDLDVIAIQNDSLRQLYRKFPEVSEIIARQMERAWRKNVEFRKIIYSSKGIDLVRWMEQTFPKVIGVAKEADIASFLNMTNVQLSRIRKKIKDTT